jgi:hypothetical protein
VARVTGEPGSNYCKQAISLIENWPNRVNECYRDVTPIIFVKPGVCSKTLDTADIVREAMFRHLSEPS